MDQTAEQLVRMLASPAGKALLGEIASLPEAERSAPRFVARLRRDASPELVALALRVAAAALRASAKFPDSGRLLFTPELLEMASSHPPAMHRARRAAPLGRAVDLGCGAGGDLTRLASLAPGPTGIERDPLAAALARANLAGLGLTGEVLTGAFPETRLPPHDLLFVDPARRGADGRRGSDARRFSPAPALIAQLLAGSPAWALKWGPALDLDHGSLSSPGGPLAGLGVGDYELELVSWRGEVREAVFWGAGARRGIPRQASVLSGVLDGFETHSFAGDPELPPPPVLAPGAWVAEPDGAVLRAGLLNAFAAAQGCGLLAREIAYLTADAPLPRPFARSWPLLESLPFGLSALQEALDRHGAGSITLKKRGFPRDPELLRPQLRLRGERHLTVLIHRVDGGHRACVCGPEWGVRPRN